MLLDRKMCIRDRLYFASEYSRYFDADKIDNDQAEDYLIRSGEKLEKLKKIMPSIFK